MGASFLRIHTCHRAPDFVQAFAAGYLEGYVSQKRTWQYYHNNLKVKPFTSSDGKLTGRMKADLPEQSKLFLERNNHFVQSMIIKFQEQPYWHVIGLGYIQIDGMYSGYVKAAPKEEEIIEYQFKLINLFASLADFSNYETETPKTKSNKFLDYDHCSALIKVTEDGKDIFFGHESFSAYETMTRIWKQYEFHYHLNRFSEELVPSTKISFSSYPTMIHSLDDFYMTNQQLAVTETTNGIFELELYRQNMKPNAVLEPHRIMVANRLARTAKEWVEISSRFNDGTYCNQWMVLDYKLFTPNEPLKDNLFYVAEQIPGDVIYMDATWALRLNGYWASYNVPYFPATWHRAGWKQKYESFGNYFHHDKTSRYLLFEREQKKVTDMTSFMEVMRSQDLYNDPLSKCSSINTTCVPDFSGRLMIASRQDLSPVDGQYPFALLAHSDHGALDAKLTSYEYMKEFKMRAISSPPYEVVPPFDWTTIADLNVTHEGLPEKWTFPWFDFGFN